MKSPRKYDASGKWIQLDERHRISRIATGNPRNPWVFQFCDDFIASYPTKKAATSAALDWEMARVNRMLA